MAKEYRGRIDLEELKEFAAEHTIKEIKAKYNVNGYSLCLRFGFPYKYAEYKRNKFDAASALRKKKILEDYKSGLKMAEIARIYGCSRQYIFQVIEQSDLTETVN